MSTITPPNIRVSSDLTIRLKLKDGGVAIDWSTLQNIRVSLYADDQRSMASRCNVSIDEEDSTILVCQYAANKMQYLGVNRVIVQCKYMGEVKTYDKPAFNFVRWTSDQEGEQITIDDPDVDVEISVEDVSSSILQEAVDAAFDAADRANDAAAAAEHMVDIHTGPEGKSAYEVAVEEGYTGTEEEWLASLKGPVGETPDISIGTVTTVKPGTPAAASMTGTPEAPVLNLSIPKGLVGATPNFTVGTVTTGQPGTPVVITITGTAEAPVLNVQIPQGMKGDTGVSANYPITIHNGLDSDATDEALAAFQGKVLDGKVSQLEAKLPMLGGYLVPLLRKIVYKDDDAESLINGINALLNTIELTSITAVYTQPGTIYAGQPLNDLKDGLVVTANYNDGTSAEVNDYELSGTLTAGTSSIVVTYQEKTTTFDVTVTDAVYYKDGSIFPGQVGLRNEITSSTGLGTSYVKDGVSYVFASSYANGGNATTQKRSCYYLFDLLVTPGKQYKYIVEFDSAPTASQTIQWSNAYYDETYRVAGVANAYQTQSYSSNVQATSWGVATKDGNTISFSDTAPSGYVGVRISLKCVVSGSDAVWPTALSVKRLIIQEVE